MTAEDSTPTTIADETAQAGRTISLIAYLWPRVRGTYEALIAAQQTDNRHTAAELLIQLRTMVLLMASEPAQTWDEVQPKVLIQALVRHNEAGLAAPAHTYLAAMLEAAIMADHAALNGDDRPNTSH